MRIFKYLCRRALLNDGAAVHEHDMIGHIAGKRHLVGDDDHGGVLTVFNTSRLLGSKPEISEE